MLYDKLKIFINTQTHEYKNIAWYKKPKYWLLFILLIFHVATKFYYGSPSTISTIFQCLYATPILLFIFIGRAFPFTILLLIYGLYYVMGTITRLSGGYTPETLLVVSWIWFIVSIIGLIATCLIIEIKRNKYPLWKQFLKGFVMCVLWVAYCLGMAYIQFAIEDHIAAKAFIADCIKYNKHTNIDDTDLEKHCSERLTELQNQLKQLRNN